MPKPRGKHPTRLIDEPRGNHGLIKPGQAGVTIMSLKRLRDIVSRFPNTVHYRLQYETTPAPKHFDNWLNVIPPSCSELRKWLKK